MFSRASPLRCSKPFVSQLCIYFLPFLLLAFASLPFTSGGLRLIKSPSLIESNSIAIPDKNDKYLAYKHISKDSHEEPAEGPRSSYEIFYGRPNRNWNHSMKVEMDPEPEKEDKRRNRKDKKSNTENDDGFNDKDDNDMEQDLQPWEQEYNPEGYRDNAFGSMERLLQLLRKFKAKHLDFSNEKKEEMQNEEMKNLNPYSNYMFAKPREHHGVRVLIPQPPPQNKRILLKRRRKGRRRRRGRKVRRPLKFRNIRKAYKRKFVTRWLVCLYNVFC